MWEKDININEVREIRTRTLVYFGCGAIEKIEDIAKDLNFKILDSQIIKEKYIDGNIIKN